METKLSPSLEEESNEVNDESNLEEGNAIQDESKAKFEKIEKESKEKFEKLQREYDIMKENNKRINSECAELLGKIEELERENEELKKSLFPKEMAEELRGIGNFLSKLGESAASGKSITFQEEFKKEYENRTPKKTGKSGGTILGLFSSLLPFIPEKVIKNRPLELKSMNCSKISDVVASIPALINYDADATGGDPIALLVLFQAASRLSNFQSAKKKMKEIAKKHRDYGVLILRYGDNLKELNSWYPQESQFELESFERNPKVVAGMLITNSGVVKSAPTKKAQKQLQELIKLGI